MTEKSGQILSGELKLYNEGSKNIGGELFLRGNNFSDFSPEFAFLLSRLQL